MSLKNFSSSFAPCFFITALVLAGRVCAHCDTYSGPVITEAKNALEKGDITPILKWVTKDDEAQIKAIFTKVLAVRTKSPEMKEIADQYFFETLVRIHRASEGAPFAGLKNTPPDPIEAMADKSLETGKVDTLITKITAHMKQEIKAKFQKAVEARKHQKESVNAGREYVEAYVTYLHYIIGIHDAITAKTGHSEGGSTEGKQAESHSHHE